MPSLDLLKLLPQRYRDKTVDTLFRNLFNRHLSKEDSVGVYGYLGDPDAGDVHLKELTLERQLNQLSPLIYAEHATEKRIYSWPDIVQKLVLLGCNYEKIGDWFSSKSYNFVPPIDLDKFCNHNQYFWVGKWVTSAPSLPFETLGLPPAATAAAVFNTYGETGEKPEYYVIERGALSGTTPVSPAPNLASWSDWAMTNMWIHREEVSEFIDAHGGLIGFEDLIQATRPIIEYSRGIRLSTVQDVSLAPSETGTTFGQSKKRKNQLPLFDLYDVDSTHLGVASAIFYYQEDPTYPVDSVIERRIVTDASNDYIFEHALADDSGRVRFYKHYNNSSDVNGTLRTIWRAGADAGPRYVKYDTSGTLINQDKITNFRNYYWTGIDRPANELPAFNVTGDPEYYVIETGGTSAWSVYNYWTHVSNLNRDSLQLYSQATRPIIEFNVKLESELIAAKVELGELPRFKHYLLDNADDTFKILPEATDPNLNDAYLQRKLFARVADLPIAKTAIETTPQLLNQCVTINGEAYIQGLSTGRYMPERDGAVYGYSARIVEVDAMGNGTISSMKTAVTCLPELLTLEYFQPTNSFTVTGTVSGAHANVPVGAPATVSGLTFTPIAGSTPFVAGDKFILEIRSYVYESRKLYVKVDGTYRTLETPSAILSEADTDLLIEATPADRDGTWEIPPQLKWNVQNETRTVIKQGDLYTHFISIIEAQDGLTGSASGKNNWRSLVSKAMGAGGTIKQYDKEVAKFISVMIQEGITIPVLLEFARQSYEHLFSMIREFIESKVPDLLVEGRVTPPSSGDSIDPDLVVEFKEFFASRSPVTAASPSILDEFIVTLFYDSTSSIYNLIATLPYLGLVPKVAPQKVLDPELNLEMLIHHDGHRSKLLPTSDDVLKKIVTKRFKRTFGNETPGVIGTEFPARPYRGQFWYKTSTKELFIYRVISDQGERPDDAENGDYSYDRLNNVLWQFNGAWVEIGSSVVQVGAPWTLVKLDLLAQNLTLVIEQELFDHCPTLTQAFDPAPLRASVNYFDFMKLEFERFGAKYNVPDVYSTIFDQANAFTWNYISATIPGTTSQHAAWQEVYLDVYGTSRPDLEPWILAGYADEATLMAALVGAGALPGGTTEWLPIFWTDFEVLTFLRARLVLLGRPQKFSVKTATAELLPPYSTDPESLLSVPPTGVADKYFFGDMGPIEIFWRKTLDFLYSEQKVFFKLDPLSYVYHTWGTKQKTLGEYTFYADVGKKKAPVDISLHGEPLTELIDATWITATMTSLPGFDQEYVLTCVSRQDGIFKVTGTGIITPQFITNFTYSNAFINVTLTEKKRGFFWGDTFKVKIDAEVPELTVEVVPQTYFRAEGLNQIYVQYSRNFGEDVAISLNSTLLKSWTPKLSYRCAGLINTDSLKMRVGSEVIETPAYAVRLKENKFHTSSWINALRVQLVHRGATVFSNNVSVPAIGPTGSYGEDWIFRVDAYNSERPGLAWYQFDLNGEHTTFTALDGLQASMSWKRYKTPSAVVNYRTPFLVTGIQNFLNFIFGYADKMHDEGWRFTDVENPIIDPQWHRTIDYQFLAEKFIVQQFSGVDAGSSFLFNPFYRKAWFMTPRGMLSNVFEALGLEQETVCSILTQHKKKLRPDQVRVFRQDDVTQLVFDEPVFTLHALTSEYEHVILLENYTVGKALIYDPFLGQQAKKVLFSGRRQAAFTGKLDFGGHFIVGDEVKKNIESSVNGLSKLYDPNVAASPEIDRARSILGFDRKRYFEDRETSEISEFKFWQGLIANKGTNLSLNAFINSSKFETANLDEYWAYRYAEYGDARKRLFPELRVEADDCTGERTSYLFLEEDESLFAMKRFDEGEYDESLFDFSTIYDLTSAEGIELFDATNMIIVFPDDETRWHKYDDLKALTSFQLKVLAEMTIVPDSLDKLYSITDKSGNPVRADCFELINVELADETESSGVYRERGDYVAATDPAEYSTAKFERVNASTIKINDVALLNRIIKVVAYGPNFEQYSPVALYNYKTGDLVRSDIIWWDPARGHHHPEAHSLISYEQAADPAKYNQTSLGRNSDPLRTWGEKQVGKLWWDTADLDWKPYHDSKIFEDVNDRLRHWGALADFSKVNVYEWVRSEVPPAEYGSETEGEVAQSYLVTRDRVWWQRVVAWKVKNPTDGVIKFLAYQPAKLKTFLTNGHGTLVVNAGKFEDYGVVRGTKIAGAIYTSTTKTDANLARIFGMAEVTSESSTISVGTAAAYTGGPTFASSNFVTTFTLEIDDQTYAFNGELGDYNLSNFTDGGVDYIKLQAPSGKNQIIEVHDTPVQAGTKDSYFFDQLGIKIFYTVTYGHADTWPAPIGGVPSEAQRKSTMATAIGNAAHDIYLRSTVTVFSPIAFVDGVTTYTTLDATADLTTNGWIAWNDPIENPNLVTNKNLNPYSPVAGEWVEVDDFLIDLASDISSHMADPWTWFGGADYTPYRSTWTTWTKVVDDFREAKYFVTGSDTLNDFLEDKFTYASMLAADVKERGYLYLNGTMIRHADWTVSQNGVDAFVQVTDEAIASEGDVITFKLVPAEVTTEDLEFDPDVADTDPYKLVQYKHDFPHVRELRRDEVSGLSVNVYYFWVKEKRSPARGKALAVNQIAALLTNHDGLYAVPQGLKWYNQLDGRPNRYAILSVQGLRRHVKENDSYKLRLTLDQTLRSDPTAELKNVHTEWILLRKFQPTRIPKKLWDTLTDSLCGESQVGDPLPFSVREIYDQRNESSIRYGLSGEQIMVDPKIARETVKYTILNTQVTRLVDGAKVPHYISYEGFDINKLDTYLSTTAEIKKLMADLWRFANPKQLSEIFFEVLEDSLAKTPELKDFFKTSYVSLNDVRIVS